jgi:hypothetical protein
MAKLRQPDSIFDTAGFAVSIPKARLPLPKVHNLAAFARLVQ